MEKQKIYYAALYLRISKEDEGKKYQEERYFSNSIENQKRFLLDYLKSIPNIVIYDSYIEASNIIGLI